MSRAIQLKDNNENVFPCPYYPIGSVYISVSEIDPVKFFGGKWEQIKDVFLLTAGSTYKAGSIGGESTHKLTIDEMPSHTHAQRSRGASSNIAASGSAIGAEFLGTSNNSIGNTYATGGSKAHNNMPPYLVVYAWKRVG